MLCFFKISSNLAGWLVTLPEQLFLKKGREWSIVGEMLVIIKIEGEGAAAADITVVLTPSGKRNALNKLKI